MGRVSPAVPQGCYYLDNRIDKKTGTQQIFIRYYWRRNLIFRATGIHILSSEWDKKGQKIYGTSQKVKDSNQFLQAFKNKVDSELLNYKGEITPPTIERILKGEPADIRDAAKNNNLVKYCYEYNKMQYTTGRSTYRTYENKNSCIKVFDKFLRSIGKQKMTIADIDVETIDNFIEYRRTTLENTSPEGINKSLVPIYKALEYASDNGLIERYYIASIIKHFIPVKKNSYVERNVDKIKYLTTEQINKLIQFHESCGRERTKEFVELWLFSYYACGLRISDIITLEWKHVDFEQKMLTKNQYKTGVDVSFPLSENAIAILQKWKKTNRKNNRFVFRLLDDDFNLKDERKVLMKKCSLDKTINASLCTVAEKIGVTFPLTMHVARHSFAVCAINNGMDIKILSRLMGHTTMLTTEKVYAKILLKTLNKEYNNKTDFYDLVDNMQI